ncbi:MAG: hypothetical protein LBB34_00435 [Holosporales bacterium]|jgi:hypothetical protein|nr:hypothetical protein [Holosporales bacterium]
MDSNIKSRYWTHKEIEMLKTGFKDGKRIKILACELGRSVTAVNKFLSRAGIRNKRGSITVHTGKKEKKRVFEVSRATLNRIYHDEFQTDFFEVVRYLKAAGYKITKNESQCGVFYNDEEYTLNGKPTSKMKLLLLANRIRTEKRQPIFSVSSVIW